MQGSILVVEHDAATRELVAGNLRSAGYQVTRARDYREADALMHKVRPDVALLDWIPGAPGLSFTRQLRGDSRTADTSIIVLSARLEEENMVAALESGADDCVSKPISMRALLARVKAVLRRRAPQRADEIVELAGLSVDPAARRVTDGQRDIDLPKTEFELLHFFITHPGWTLTRRKLLDEIWGDNVYVEDRTVDVHVRRLRRALPATHSVMIETVRGFGYRWRMEPEPMPTPALYSAVANFVARTNELSDLSLLRASVA